MGDQVSSPPRRIGRIGLPAAVICALFGACLGLGAFTFDYAEGTSYLSNDPKACVNCHIMREQYDSWQKGPHHANAMCNDCHVPHDFMGKYLTKMDHGYRHSKGFTFQNFHEPIQIKPSSLKVVEDNCIRCHTSMVGEFVAHAQVKGEHVSCIHCHSNAGHGPQR